MIAAPRLVGVAAHDQTKTFEWQQRSQALPRLERDISFMNFPVVPGFTEKGFVQEKRKRTGIETQYVTQPIFLPRFQSRMCGQQLGIDADALPSFATKPPAIGTE